MPERAGVRFAGVRVVVDFAAVVRLVPVFAAGLLVPDEAPVVRVVVRGARGVDAGAAGVDPSSGEPGVAVLGSVSSAALAGVRFAAVVRAAPVFAAVVRAVPVFAAVDREPVERVVVVFFAVPVASVESAPVVARAALGRFAGAFVVPEVRGVVVLGARFAADGAGADWSSAALGCATPGASGADAAGGLVDGPSAGVGCSAGSGGVVEVTKQTYQQQRPQRTAESQDEQLTHLPQAV
ncbi:hypothetical protein ITJ57_08165 [Plantibacter sp. VKM Ac-2880]|uniref:hypothetical protein n=1 Tax=Plantibacter sp. VKM Ac-2880 TaxID=2783827 RepID=UPI00188EB773|nr:hypothetical protein [Plantibacter sp. VKM Ac-2880]MBF4568745.1 hypothetical protein [Plantibacter sp. VKM Ac-2880]